MSECKKDYKRKRGKKAIIILFFILLASIMNSSAMSYFNGKLSLNEIFEDNKKGKIDITNGAVVLKLTENPKSWKFNDSDLANVKDNNIFETISASTNTVKNPASGTEVTYGPIVFDSKGTNLTTKVKLNLNYRLKKILIDKDTDKEYIDENDGINAIMGVKIIVKEIRLEGSVIDNINSLTITTDDLEAKIIKIEDNNSIIAEVDYGDKSFTKEEEYKQEQCNLSLKPDYKYEVYYCLVLKSADDMKLDRKLKLEFDSNITINSTQENNPGWTEQGNN